MNILLIKNIKEIIKAEICPSLRLYGKDMSSFQSIKDAYLIIKNEKVAEIGKMSDIQISKLANAPDIKEFNAEGRFLFPSFCDSHTHLVYAESRESEFVDKIKGLTYEEIAKKGGGILNSASKVNKASEEYLYDKAFERLEEVKSYGTGAIEIKSGYGLSVNDELKILRVIKKLKENTDIRIKATFLGAHAIPLDYKDRRNDYVNLIINRMIPQISAEGLADYCDVFCEEGFFSNEETEKIINVAVKYGLKSKIHANQLYNSGGVQIAVKNNSLSADHLETIGDEEIDVLKDAFTMPTLLPSSSFFLNMHYAPARKMIDRGLSIALASDYNPGSSPSGNMQFVCSLGCIKLRMTPEEVINATTTNAAYAMEVSKTHGSITVGKPANLFITKKMSSYSFLPYSFGSNVIEYIILNGKSQ